VEVDQAKNHQRDYDLEQLIEKVGRFSHDSMGEKATAIEAQMKQLSRSLEELDSRVSHESEARSNFTGTMKARLDTVERRIESSPPAGNTDPSSHKLVPEVDRRLQEIEANLESMRDQCETIRNEATRERHVEETRQSQLDERLHLLDSQISKTSEGQQRDHLSIQVDFKQMRESFELLDDEVKKQLATSSERQAAFEAHNNATLKFQELSSLIAKEQEAREKSFASLQSMESKHLELTGRLSTLSDSLNSVLEAQKEQHADAHRSMSEEIALQGRSHATFEERLKVLERCLEDSMERLKEHSQFNASVDSRLVTISDVQKHLGKLEAQLEQGQRSLSGTLDVLHGQVKGDKELRDVHHASTDERLQAIETFIGESGFKVTDHGTRLEVV